jgi:3-deoxy-manno-octulosonate cytidylyltransferase (CMP-KDO synthetase)
LCRQRQSVQARETNSGAFIRTIGIIPARFQSVRFPGKLLQDLGGRPVVVRVLEQAQKAGLDRVVVATDDRRIEAAILNAGGTAVMTAGEFQTGTDRVASALRSLTEPGDSPDDIIVNIQGDEPFIEPDLIAAVAGMLRENPRTVMATAATPAAPGERDDPNAVKVVLADTGRALYFSRAPIPAGGGYDPATEPATLRHIGLYAFRREFLERFVGWPPGRLETIEKLEQLRALERDVSIQVIVRSSDSFGIDTPEDLERARVRLKGLSRAD